MWVRSLGQEDPLGGGHGNPLQYSCLGNPMDRAVHAITKSQSQLKQLSVHVRKRVKWGNHHTHSLYVYIFIYIKTTLYQWAPGKVPCIICYLFLAAFKNFPSRFIFNCLIMICLGIIPILFILFEVYWASCIYRYIFFTKFRIFQ